MKNEAEFRDFVATNGGSLLHAARLLTGDHHRAEDLVQNVLIKMLARWGRVDEPMAYARRALVTSHIDATRRRSWSERPSDDLPDEADRAGDATAGYDTRDELRRILAELPPRERAVIVLRYYYDQSEKQTAETLGLPVGTVKSVGSRALARLRVEAATATGGGR